MSEAKPEPVSSLKSPTRHGGNNRSSTRRRRQGPSSASATVPATNIPSDEPGASGPSTLRRTRSQLAMNKSESKKKQNNSDTDGDDNADETGTPDPHPEPPRRRSRAQGSLHKGNTEPYVKTIVKYSPAAPVPRTTSSKRKDGTEKRSLHRFTNEEHRFIWFYRNDLGCSRGDTYVHFNEYFGLHIRKDSIANTYERLRQKRPAEICNVQHTEPWAVGENYDAGAEEPAATPGGGPEEVYSEEDDWDSDESVFTPPPAPIPQEPGFVPDLTKSQDENPSPAKPTRTETRSGGDIIPESEHGLDVRGQNSGSRKRPTSVLESDSSPEPPPKPKRRPYHRRERNSSPTPPARKRIHFGKRRIERDPDSSGDDLEVAKKTVGSPDGH
ncbi:hypothetical protein C7212DRAFT_345408 [Tuber magnatum]|uniref:Uncharacterized protein n=1 Tax=Tuber magnatum TaxID=42249 RepID=A0A317SM81_9PEZI|nr:hypothetical protein C7212DRAFT_345408 [Tuber magnatum]